jgi:hypothetical protein
MASSGFWTIPKEIPERTPLTILREQASALSDATNGYLYGNAELTTSGDTFHVDLSIVAPSLDNYTFIVLSVTYNVYLYPVEIYFHATTRVERANNESEFEDILKKLLAAPEIQKVIVGLISQIQH